MKDVRLGESLWNEWTGEGYDPQGAPELVYYTIDHVDTDNEIVRRALASTLQRDGIADSLSDGFKMLEKGVYEFGFAGYLEGESDYTVCDENAETQYGDYVDEPLPFTWIEL